MCGDSRVFPEIVRLLPVILYQLAVSTLQDERVVDRIKMTVVRLKILRLTITKDAFRARRLEAVQERRN